MKNLNKNISIILPVYNERETLEKVLKEWVAELRRHKLNYTFIICEDGSTDGTKELLKSIKSKYKLTLHMKKERIGYGGAIMGGINIAKTKYVLFVDSDGQFDPLDFIKFWEKRDKADIIKGWRDNRVDPLNRKIYSFLFKLFFIILFGNKSHDPSIGYVLFKRSKVVPIINNFEYLREGFGWGFTAVCIKNNLSIIEFPVNNRLRLKGNTNVYKLNKIPSIAIRNMYALIRLRIA